MTLQKQRRLQLVSFAVTVVLSTLLMPQSTQAFVFAPSGSFQRHQSPRSLSVRVVSSHVSVQSSSSLAAAEASSDAEATLTPRDKQVYEFLQELSASSLPFRIVVVGNGGILESTSPLGGSTPKINFKLAQSAKNGQHIVTFATEDQSFEFHVFPAQVASVTLVEKPSPHNKDKTMRIMRLLRTDGGSICSLILADDSQTASDWYGGMTEKYGTGLEF